MPASVLSSSNPPFHLLLSADLEGGCFTKEAQKGEAISSIVHSQKVAEPGFEAKFA